jgi:hypothetical protein
VADDELGLAIGALEAILGRKCEPFDALAFVEMYGEQVLAQLKGVRDARADAAGDGVAGD